MIWLAVGGGGAIGAMLRYVVNRAIQGWLRGPFPAGIFVVNLIGCLAIGLLAGAFDSGRLQVSDAMRAFLIVGIVGGFTTFSSFGLDTLLLGRAGMTAAALSNVAGQVVFGLGAVWLGFALTSRPL